MDNDKAIRKSINGHVTCRVAPNRIYVEGRGVISDDEAYEELGIGKMERQFSLAVTQFKQL